MMNNMEIFKKFVSYDSDLDIKVGDRVYVKGYILVFSYDVSRNIYALLSDYKEFIVDQVSPAVGANFWIEFTTDDEEAFDLMIEGETHRVGNNVLLYDTPDYPHPENHLFTIKKKL